MSCAAAGSGHSWQGRAPVIHILPPDYIQLQESHTDTRSEIGDYMQQLHITKYFMITWYVCIPGWYSFCPSCMYMLPLTCLSVNAWNTCSFVYFNCYSHIRHGISQVVRECRGSVSH